MPVSQSSALLVGSRAPEHFAQHYPVDAQCWSDNCSRDRYRLGSQVRYVLYIPLDRGSHCIETIAYGVWSREESRCGWNTVDNDICADVCDSRYLSNDVATKQGKTDHIEQSSLSKGSAMVSQSSGIYQ